jgi:hypothetical protein
MRKRQSGNCSATLVNARTTSTRRFREWNRDTHNTVRSRFASWVSGVSGSREMAKNAIAAGSIASGTTVPFVESPRDCSWSSSGLLVAITTLADSMFLRSNKVSARVFLIRLLAIASFISAPWRLRTYGLRRSRRIGPPTSVGYSQRPWKWTRSAAAASLDKVPLKPGG